VNVKRNVERFGGFEDVPELRIVEELALRVRVDDDALESQLADGAFGFDSRGEVSERICRSIPELSMSAIRR